jgi:formylglycine-generating enzyme required for sulfatase activity
MIAFPCPACGKDVSVGDDLVGKQGSCPYCKASLLVPAPVAVPAQPDAASLAESSGDQTHAVTSVLPEDTPSSPDVSLAQLDFLAPPQQAGELGRLGPYAVLKILGTGGMGMVLLAEDPMLKRSVALKVMRPELAADSTSRARFLREAQATAAIDHPHIIRIFQVGEDRGVPFIAMPLLKGEPLDARLKRAPRLSVAEAVQIAKQTAEGLAAAHKHGLIHRDIKPANIWLSDDGETGVSVKIVDFGLARAIAGDDARLTKVGTILGTPAYMAPEQARSERVDYRCDLFSLGAVLYRMLTGELPFKGHDTMSLLMSLAADTPLSVASLNPEVPAVLDEVVRKLLEKDPARRLASARAVAETLLEIEQKSRLTRATTPSEDGTLVMAGEGRFPLRRKVAGILGVLLGLLVALTLIYSRTAHTPDSPNNPVTPSMKRDLPTSVTNSLGMKFALIPAGTFTMGSPKSEIDRALSFRDAWEKDLIPTEGPPHEVEITQPFYMGVAEVTVGQFRQFVEEAKYNVGDDRWKKPGFDQFDDYPVVFVSWHNAIAFCDWLTNKERGVASAPRYRLPTEAEWEHSCRAGKDNLRYGFGDDDAKLEDYCWYNRNSGGGTKPVGKKKPNDWGLYDMHGNAWEWCQDNHDPNYYKASPKQDPTGPGAGSRRVIRGGSWVNASGTCRSAFRSAGGPGDRERSIGFRVVLVVPSPDDIRP